MSEINEQVEETENLDSILKNIENTMEEISILEKSKNYLREKKTSLETFYTKFLIFVIILNHFNTLVDTNYTLVSTVYNTINDLPEVSEVSEVPKHEEEYNVIDYTEGIEIEDVD